MEQDELFYKYQQNYFENQIEQFEIAIKFIMQYSDILADFSKKLSKLNHDFNSYMKKFQFNLLIDYIRVLFETKSINTINLVKNIKDFTKDDLLKVLQSQKQKLIQGFRILRNIHKTTKDLKKEFESKDYYFQKFENTSIDRDTSNSLLDSINQIYSNKISQKKDYKSQKNELIQQTSQLKQTRIKFLKQINRTQVVLQTQNQEMFNHIKDLLRKLFVFEFSSMKNQEYDMNNLIKDFEQNISFSTKMTQKIQLPQQEFFNKIVTRNFQLQNYDIFQSEYNYFKILNMIISNLKIEQENIYEFEMLSQNFQNSLKLIEYLENFDNYSFIELSNINYELLKKEVFERMINLIDFKNDSILFRFIFQFQFFYSKNGLSIQYFKKDIEKLNILEQQTLWKEAIQQIYGLQLKRNSSQQYIEQILNQNYLISLQYLQKNEAQDIFSSFDEEDLDFAQVLIEQDLKIDKKRIFLVQIINKLMINFTQKNFNFEEFKKIKKVLKDATYVSVDCEFTKVSSQINNFDPQAVVHQKYKQVVKDALLTELGISIFTHKDKIIETNVYNFSLFPDKHSRKKFVKAENSCLYFLAVQDFNFKKCFEEGIEFTRLSKSPQFKDMLSQSNSQKTFQMQLKNQEEDLKTNIEDKKIDIQIQKRRRLLTKNQYPTQDIYEKDQDCLKKYREFLESEDQQYKFQIEDKSLRNFLSCPKSDFYSQIILDNKVSFHGKKASIKLKKKSEKQQEQCQKKLNSDPEEPEINTYFDYFGLSLLFYYLSLWDIPVVFHNGLFDYYYIYQTFYSQIPNDLEQFLNTRLFNSIYDTKQLVLKNPKSFKTTKTQLRALCDKMINKFGEDILKNKFEFNLKEISLEQNGYDKLDMKEGHTHEAGYDSFITGVVFYCIQHTLGDKIKININQIPQSHLGTFYLEKNYNPQYTNLYINKKMIGKSFFIQYNKKQIRNITEQEEIELIKYLGRMGDYEVEDDEQQYAHILYKNLDQNFDLKNFIEQSNKKFQNYKFLEFEKIYKQIHPEKLN